MRAFAIIVQVQQVSDTQMLVQVNCALQEDPAVNQPADANPYLLVDCTGTRADIEANIVTALKTQLQLGQNDSVCLFGSLIA